MEELADALHAIRELPEFQANASAEQERAATPFQAGAKADLILSKDEYRARISRAGLAAAAATGPRPTSGLRLATVRAQDSEDPVFSGGSTALRYRPSSHRCPTRQQEDYNPITGRSDRRHRGSFWTSRLTLP